MWHERRRGPWRGFKQPPKRLGHVGATFEDQTTRYLPHAMPSIRQKFLKQRLAGANCQTVGQNQSRVTIAEALIERRATFNRTGNRSNRQVTTRADASLEPEKIEIF